jgi:hypothetical protein
MILLMLCHSLSPFLFPEFHKIVPVLLTCSTYELVYDHTYFCVYDYLLDLSSMYERKHVAFVFLSLAYFTYHDVLQLHSDLDFTSRVAPLIKNEILERPGINF